MLKQSRVVLLGVFLSSCGVDELRTAESSGICEEPALDIVKTDDLVGIWSNASNTDLVSLTDEGVAIVNDAALRTFTYEFIDESTYERIIFTWTPLTVAVGFGFDGHSDYDYGTYVLDGGVIIFTSTETDSTYSIEVNQIGSDMLTLSSSDFCGEGFSSIQY